MTNHIIITPLDDGSARAIDAHGNVWHFDLPSAQQLYGVVPERSDYQLCGSDTVMMTNTVMGEVIER